MDLVRISIQVHADGQIYSRTHEYSVEQFAAFAGTASPREMVEAVAGNLFASVHAASLTKEKTNETP